MTLGFDAKPRCAHGGASYSARAFSLRSCPCRFPRAFGRTALQRSRVFTTRSGRHRLFMLGGALGNQAGRSARSPFGPLTRINMLRTTTTKSMGAKAGGEVSRRGVRRGVWTSTGSTRTSLLRDEQAWKACSSLLEHLVRLSRRPEFQGLMWWKLEKCFGSGASS